MEVTHDLIFMQVRSASMEVTEYINQRRRPRAPYNAVGAVARVEVVVVYRAQLLLQNPAVQIVGPLIHSKITEGGVARAVGRARQEQEEGACLCFVTHGGSRH